MSKILFQQKSAFPSPQGLTKSRRETNLNYENFKTLLDPRNRLTLSSSRFQTFGTTNIVTMLQSKSVRGIYIKRIFRDANLISTMSIWKYKQLQELAMAKEGVPEKMRKCAESVYAFESWTYSTLEGKL